MTSEWSSTDLCVLDARGPWYYSKPDVLDSIPQDRHTVIEASAGTGKTYTIEHLFVELLLERGLRLDQVLVLTFTEKAASELRERVRRILEAIPRGMRTEPPKGPHWVIDRVKRRILEQSLINYDTAAIHTIHAFFQSVLQQYAFETGRLFNQTIVDGRRAFHEAFQICLRTRFAVDPVDREYLQAWLDGRQSVADLEELLDRCHKSKARILPHFSEEEFQAVVDRARSGLLPNVEQLIEDLTTDGVRTQTRNAIRIRLAPLVDLLQAVEGRSTAALLGQLKSVDFDFVLERLPADSSSPVVRDFRNGLQELESLSIDFRAAIVHRFLGPVQQTLCEQKQADGSFDFDDMIENVWETLSSPRGKLLLERLRRQYRVALVDEFQDTDDCQWSIFRKVFLDSGGSNLLYVIGDPKQAIYAFRGADVHAYERARQTIVSSSDQNAPVVLKKNFRSSPGVIDAYNAIFDQDAEPPFFDGTITYNHPVVCGNPSYRLLDHHGRDAKSCVVWDYTPLSDKTKAPDLTRTFAYQIAAEIDRILHHEDGRLILSDGKGRSRPVCPKDIFVLAFKNEEARQVGEQLRAFGVPHAFYKQEGLFSSPETLDVRDLLASICDPLDRSRRYKAWLTPFFGVQLDDLAELQEVPDSSELMQRLNAWHEMANKRDFGGLFSSILADSGVIRREILLADSERSLTNYQHLFDLLLEETSRHSYDLDGLVEQLDRWRTGVAVPPGENGDTHRLESDRDAVQIMTMHKSKGLEAAVVFLFGGYTRLQRTIHAFHDDEGMPVVHIGKSPDAEQRAKTQTRQEDQRLLYVAVTRAKFRFYLPLVRSEIRNRFLNGPYNLLSDRLQALLATESESLQHFDRVEVQQRFFVPEASRRQDVDLTQWTAPEPAAEEGPTVEEMKRLRWRHRPFTVTSYTSLQRQIQFERDKEAEREDFERDKPTHASLLAEGDLPAGAQTGTFLHAILENIDVETFLDASFDEWRQRDDVQELVRREALKHSIDGVYLDATFQTVYRAMTHSFKMDATAVAGLWTSPRIAREIEFLFPIPEADHPRLDNPETRMVRVQKGFVKGFVDLVFEHERKVYFLDWKSNLLPGYDYATIQEEVRRDYDLQLRLYSIAMMKLLQIHDQATYEDRFGGLLYVFLRGLPADSRSQAGVYFHRPSWSDVLAFETDLKSRRIQ